MAGEGGGRGNYISARRPRGGARALRAGLSVAHEGGAGGPHSVSVSKPSALAAARVLVGAARTRRFPSPPFSGFGVFCFLSLVFFSSSVLSLLPG